MSTGTQVAKLLQKRQAKLERQIERAERSIQSWKDEIRALSGVVASLRALGGAPAPRGRGRTKARGRKRGTWKPGRPGRPPEWYRKEQAAKGASSAPRKGRRRKRRAAKPAAAQAS